MAVAIPYIMAAATVAGAKAAIDTRKSQKRAEEAQTANIAQQKATLTRQEAVQAQQQSDLAQQAQMRVRAKRSGGLRMLLSGEETGLSGVGSESKLGGGA